MIEEAAVVIAIEGKHLLVQAQPSSACGGCHARSACGQGLLSKYFNQTPGQLLIPNRSSLGEVLTLEVGDEIIIGINEGSVLSGAFYAYLLPLFFMVGFAILAQVFNIQSEPAQILITLIGLVLGVVSVRIFFQGNQKHLKNILPELIRKSSGLRKLPVQQDN